MPAASFNLKPLSGGYAALLLKLVLRFWTPRYRAIHCWHQRNNLHGSRRENASGSRIIEAKLLLSGIAPENLKPEDCGALSTKSPARHRRKLLLPT